MGRRDIVLLGEVAGRRRRHLAEREAIRGREEAIVDDGDLYGGREELMGYSSSFADGLL